MRAYHRGIAVAVVLSLGLAVGGCESMPDFENMFNTKKRLPGERKEVFPGGVPGVTQGVPQEYMKGNQAAAEVNAAPVTPVSSAPVEEAAPPPPVEAKPKPKPKPRVAARPKPAPAEPAPAEPAPARQQQQPAATAPWPSQPAQQQSRPAGTSPWPDAPPTGTFSR